MPDMSLNECHPARHYQPNGLVQQDCICKQKREAFALCLVKDIAHLFLIVQLPVRELQRVPRDYTIQ